MDQFIQFLPYDALGKRTMRLESDRLVLVYKNLTRNFTDEHPYAKINPDFRYVRRGEDEWDNVLLALVISAIVLVFIAKTLHSPIVKMVALGVPICMLFAAVYLLGLKFIKRNFCYILDDSGETIVAIKVTPRSKAFIAKLKAKIEKGGEC